MGLRFRNLNIELSSACNFACSYCPGAEMTRDKTVMSYEMATSLLDQIHEMELTDYINFYHMGESLLNKRAPDIFRYARKLGFRIKLNTNGSRLDAEMRDELLDIGVDELFISYHSSFVQGGSVHRLASPISFERWHEQIVATIEDRYRKKSRTSITLILFRIAEATRSEMLGGLRVPGSSARETDVALRPWKDLAQRLASEHGIPSLYQPPSRSLAARILGQPLERVNRSVPLLPGLTVSLTKLHTWNNDVIGEEARLRGIRKARFGGCDALSDTMAICADGSYSLCCADWDGQLLQGNAAHQPLREFLESPRAQGIRESFASGRLPFDYCRQCRGGSTLRTWAFNQTHSYVFHTSSKYRSLRRLLKMG